MDAATIIITSSARLYSTAEVASLLPPDPVAVSLLSMSLCNFANDHVSQKIKLPCPVQHLFNYVIIYCVSSTMTATQVVTLLVLVVQIISLEYTVR
jgi:hypothetical protein